MFNLIIHRLKSWFEGYRYRFHCNFYGNYKIGFGTKIGSYCDIGGKIGKDCIIQSFVFIPPLTIIEDRVFIGPGVVICNDKNPPSDNLKGVLIEKQARIGAGATILPGITIGNNSMIGAGSVVVHDVLPGSIVFGNPAKEKLLI